MPAYLGKLGHLVALGCASTERTGSAARYVTRVTVEGRRIAQVIPASPRIWDVSWGIAYPDEMTRLTEFTAGAWGPGPWHWLPEQAVHGNLLTPAESMCLVDQPFMVRGGPMRAADGSLAASSFIPASPPFWSTLATNIPVLPGRPVTFSADVVGDGETAPQLAVAFYDAAGASLSVVYQEGSNTPSVQRVSQTRTAPDGAVSMAVGFRWMVVRACRPQVTWGDVPVPFTVGHGCRAAVLDPAVQDLIHINSKGPLADVSFTVMEVG